MLEMLLETRLVAVIRLPELKNAVPLAEALLAGGIPVMEFTLTTEGAFEAIREVKKALAGAKASIGVGSVVTVEQAVAAVDAGAEFIVSPVTKAEIINFGKANQIAVMPGAFTPTEIQTAWEWGADVVKVFPARALGAKYLADVLAPLPHLRLMPTGGIDLENIQDYLKSGAVAVGVGGKLLDKQVIAAGRWSEITAAASMYANAAVPKDQKK
ncbi:MAG: bifunctional 4-hydroxy-2-oxoglutarate aldolase/2-dehydro-3-deoxy-phosphogluconate aldolase [Anaerolineae bacterium]|nr:bifunctional 4-hydroxy-2-oxoglutarate aldolase/2-dehydro-3-deoxy-phosphogluconate aldolase [Anaerolineae bacterium]